VRERLGERILVLDGAMGTMIQRHRLDEATSAASASRPPARAARQQRPARADAARRHPRHPRGVPRGRRRHHRDQHLHSTRIAQADYGLEALAYELNVAGARLAREAADAWTARTPDRPRFVAGPIGPTNRTLSISPDVNDPAFRADHLRRAARGLREQVRGLVDGGATCSSSRRSSTRSTPRRRSSRSRRRSRSGARLPMMISVTITDRSGRTLSGQTVEAFWISVAHARRSASASTARSARATCALRRRARRSPTLRQLLPERRPAQRLRRVRRAPDTRPRPRASSPTRGCSTSSAAAAARRPSTSPRSREAVARAAAAQVPEPPASRASAASSRSRSAPTATSDDRRAHERHRLEALRAARQGRRLRRAPSRWRSTRCAAARTSSTSTWTRDARLRAAMTTFLNLIATEPEIARVPIMIDSSKWSVIEAGLKCVQGKGDRQLDQPEGGRGRLPRQGAARAALRRGRRRDGVRRAGPGRDRRAQGRDLPARLPAAHRAGRLRPPTSSSTRTSSRSHRHRGARRYASRFIEATRRDQGDAARARR
jgi:5-methyltetrahydrofolate--homocysteine methyltransferase